MTNIGGLPVAMDKKDNYIERAYWQDSIVREACSIADEQLFAFKWTLLLALEASDADASVFETVENEMHLLME